MHAAAPTGRGGSAVTPLSAAPHAMPAVPHPLRPHRPAV